MKHFAGLAFLKLWVISSLFLIHFSSSAQDIAVGTWRTHFSYNDAKIIEQTSDKIFCSSLNGLFSLDLRDNSIRKLSKIDGLSDVGIASMKYDPQNKVLIIGYRSGLIDLIFEDKIETIQDIFNSSLEGNKSINDVTFDAERIYLATGLGIIVINTLKSEIVENYVQIGVRGNEVEVIEIHHKENQLMIRTEQGIQSGSLTTNLLDFNNWTHFSNTTSFDNLTLFIDQYYALQGDDLFQLVNDDWEDTAIDIPVGASKIFAVGNQLTTTTNGIVYGLSDGVFEPISTTNAINVNDMIETGNAFIYATSIGLIDDGNNIISPAGPISDTFSMIRVIENEVYGFHAPSPFSYDGSEKTKGYSFFSKGSWSYKEIDGFQNISDVAKYNSEFYFSSIGDGIFNQSNNETITPYTSADTVINVLKAGGKLWASSFDSTNPILFMDQSEEWGSFSNADLFENRYTSIDLTVTNNAWLGGASGSITVIEEDQDLIDRISTANGLPSSFIDIDLSIEDDAWIATSRGPALFTNASFIGNNQAIRPSFESRTLFEDEMINTVMTDGGNRIWFGTNRGLWVFDENTSTQAALFNEFNSPIPSNTVLDLVYNPVNGEVFIYTDKGLVSFRSSSSIGGRTHQNVTVFPNPVRPDYTGLVGIKGVAKNVSVKITDVNGNLVKEVVANGGTASWDLLDVTNSPVTTGVYFLFSSSADGVETYVGKLAVVR